MSLSAVPGFMENFNPCFDTNTSIYVKKVSFLGIESSLRVSLDNSPFLVTVSHDRPVVTCDIYDLHFNLDTVII